MSNTLKRLAERRENLVAQAAAQRRAVAQTVAPWHAPLALADRGLEALRTVRRHPVLLLGAALVFARLRRGRAGKWPRYLWAGWQIGRRIFRD